MTTAFSEVLHRFVARYRARLLLKAAWLAALGLGVAAALAWRLHRLQVSPAWAIGVPSLLGVAAAAALAVWLRRRWMARRGGAAFLDRTLGLQQRLVTAEEFADAATPPLLYPLLVEDVAHRVLSKDVRLPTPWDRTTLALTALLLLLLLWPGLGGSVLQQLAQLPRMAPPSPRPEPPPQPEPPPPPQQGERQASGASQPQPGGSSGNQGEPSQQGQQSSGSQDQPSGSSGSSQSSSGGGEGQQDSSGQGQSADSSGQEGQTQDGSGSQSEGQRPRDARPQGERQGERADQRGESGQTTAKTSQDGQKGQGEQGAGGARERTDGQGQQGQSGGAQQQQAAAAAAAEARSGRGGGQSAGDQEALRAEIQELLQEVSGELKQLQAQLAEAHGDTAPDAGASTDPDLYEAQAPLGPDAGAAGRPLPMSLGTDAAPTNAARRGGGVGKPSDVIATDAPTAEAEEAELSEAPLDERAAERQVVPPEYRDVFDRLQKTRSP